MYRCDDELDDENVDDDTPFYDDTDGADEDEDEDDEEDDEDDEDEDEEEPWQVGPGVAYP